MASINVDDVVRLTLDLPELMLKAGEEGVVRATWFATTSAYEVEFSNGRRALLLPEQVCLVSHSTAQ